MARTANASAPAAAKGKKGAKAPAAPAPRQRLSRLPLEAGLKALTGARLAIADMAKSMKISERDCRLVIDALRRKGHKVERLAPSVFGLPGAKAPRKPRAAKPAAEAPAPDAAPATA